MAPEDPTPPSERPVSSALPLPSLKALLSGMQSQLELGFQQLGLITFTPKAGHAPNSAPSSCGPELLAASAPHLTTHPSPGEEKYHQGGLSCH